MTVFEKIKAMDIEEFAEWFNKNCSNNEDPCINWWDNNYCSNCEAEIAKYEDSNRDIEFAWCDLHGKCKFFQNMDQAPNALQMTKLWLESEV